ncbi:NAD(P)-dependent glycerol-3-phosphate dehydrogenase [Mameliella alba]|uniref:NAD(P)H-dependent glycerol-3-phosphate dehydrogenase n=1 Tax=Mameliella alba TaxID=561184 RepID=UPI001C93F041|nr:NAD(P)H-dependent glycerol-3-phosphate dehydrogenase [Mameliella alba]MBY6122531.1 NAD(P)-dependent glycerol-3-phosphate dehydrogenase [Mameliella alba]
MSIAVLGGGAFGTALAVALGRKRAVTLWARDVTGLHDTRQSPRLPGVTLPDAVTVTGDLNEAATCDTLLLSVPMQQLSTLLDRIATPLDGHALVACCKGIDLAEGVGPSALIARHQPGAVPAVLTGPSFAGDIARGLPTALTLACGDEPRGRALQEQLSTPVLRLYRSDDMIGAELGGALKNVIAIACGACIGAGLGDSARAALMTRGFAEMMLLSARLGARPETLTGLSGLGDLTLTCTSDGSRNYRFGLALGRGEDFDPSVTVEGAATARAAARLSTELDLPLPVCSVVADLSQGRLTVRQAMDTLLSRPLKDE